MFTSAIFLSSLFVHSRTFFKIINQLSLFQKIIKTQLICKCHGRIWFSYFGDGFGIGMSTLGGNRNLRSKFICKKLQLLHSVQPAVVESGMALPRDRAFAACKYWV